MPVTVCSVVAFESIAKKAKNLHDVDAVTYYKNRGKHEKQKHHNVLAFLIEISLWNNPKLIAISD